MLMHLAYGDSLLAVSGLRALLLLGLLFGNRLTRSCRYLLSGVSSFSVGEVGLLLSCCARPLCTLQPLTCCFSDCRWQPQQACSGAAWSLG